jgi:hypothetical protein
VLPIYCIVSVVKCGKFANEEEQTHVTVWLKVVMDIQLGTLCLTWAGSFGTHIEKAFVGLCTAFIWS